MKTIPLFLTLFVFLMTGTGCVVSRSPVAEPPVAVPAPRKAVAVKPADKIGNDNHPPVGSLYNDLVVNGPFARYARGEPIRQQGKMEYICVCTGQFNIAPSGDHLLMKTWCVERHPHGETISVIQAKDQKAPRIREKPDIFQVPFEDAVVSAEKRQDDSVEVGFHYRDKEMKFHHLTLKPRPGEKYRYSFKDLAKEAVMPIGRLQIMEPQS